jgi:hypothetical protein
MASSAARGSEKKQPLGRISHSPSTLGPSVLNSVYCLPQQQAHIHLPDRSLRQQHKLAQIGHSNYHDFQCYYEFMDTPWWHWNILRCKSCVLIINKNYPQI